MKRKITTDASDASDKHDILQDHGSLMPSSANFLDSAFQLLFPTNPPDVRAVPQQMMQESIAR